MSYNIVRFYRHGRVNSLVVQRGLTLEQAQAHCSNPETSSSTATNRAARDRTRRRGPWFDGYEEAK